VDTSLNKDIIKEKLNFAAMSQDEEERSVQYSTEENRHRHIQRLSLHEWTCLESMLFEDETEAVGS
jgi:hypothetical protein